MSQIRTEETTDGGLTPLRVAGVSGDKALHRRETGGKGASGARAMRPAPRNEASARGIVTGNGIAIGRSQCQRVDIPQHPTAATRESAAPGATLPPGTPTHPAPGQRAETRRPCVAVPMHQQRLTPATTPTTAPYHPSPPTHGTSRKTPWRSHPADEGPAGRPAPAPRQAQG